jgi:hypothetical protein
MRLAHPEWLLLLPVLTVVGWYWRGLRWHRPLRAAILLLATLLLARPEWRSSTDGLDLWVLVDRSDSCAARMESVRTEWESLLERSRGPRDRIFHIDYADSAVRRDEGDAVFRGARNRTRTGFAIQYALSRREPRRAARLLVLTDGHATEPLDGVAERLVREGTALDFRTLPIETTGDARIESLVLPQRARSSEAFLVEVVVSAPGATNLPIEIRRDDQPVATRTVAIENGIGRLRFTDRLPVTGAYRYSAQISTVDPLPGNNTAERWIEIAGGPRILLVTSYPDDPVAAALQRQGFSVELVSDPATASVGRLAGARVVILNNVPAYRLPRDFLAALDFFVTEQGGGLLMSGGKTSFASGGFFGSPVEPVLPVSMELRHEHRKLATAMAIVMDRSGSMAVAVPGSGKVKMDLANEGAGRAIELLGAQDLITVTAVDSKPHEVLPLATVEPDRAARIDSVRRVRSTGGGIFVYEGLADAWNRLRDASVGQKHVVLFSDAADSEEPGAYKKLLAEMTGAGATVSVIGLGTESDSDADLLKDVAKLGNGRIFFCNDAAELPALFAQETVAVARSAFIRDPVALVPTPEWGGIAARPLEWLKSVDGYNLSYLKPGASAAALSGDEYRAPLVAYWQRGAGRAAAVCFPLGGEHSSAQRAWPQFGDFTQTLTRWLMGDTLPPGIGLRTVLRGSRLDIELTHDATWDTRVLSESPRLILATGASGSAELVVWTKLKPGLYSASLDLQPGQWVRGAVRVGGASLPFGPVVTSVNPEWSFDRARVNELRNVAGQSGGTERMDLASVWRAPRPAAWSDLSPALLLVLLVLFLVEALQTRTGWLLPPRRRNGGTTA